MLSIRKFDTVMADRFLEANEPLLVANGIEGLA